MGLWFLSLMEGRIAQMKPLLQKKKDDERWLILHEIYHNLAPSVIKRAVETEYGNLYAEHVERNSALEAAFISNGIFVPGTDREQNHKMDAAKEYDDILADQAAFEALRED